MKIPSTSPRAQFGRFALFTLLAALPGLARAQAVDQGSAPPAAKPGALAEGEVVKLETFTVTGSHIPGSSTFTSPTPVLIVEADALRTTAPANMADGLKQLPAIAPGGGQTVGGGTGNNSANFLNLRGLGETRTLTLFDGRRFTPSGPTGQVDSNMIPQGLVSHVDIVTGGASAAYGSDAVGGVINYVLNKEFTGFKTDTYYGISQQGDNEEYKATLTFGTDYLGGRGHLVASGEYLESKGVSGSDRDFRFTEPNQIQDPNNTSKLVRAADIRTPYTTGGLIVTGAGGTAANNAKFRGIKFASDGSRSAYDYGTLANTVGKTSGLQDGGDGYRVGTSQEIVRPLTRKNLFAHTDFKLTDVVTLFAEGAYSESHMDVQNSPSTHTLTIKRNNAYLAQVAPDLVAQMTSLGVTSLTMNRLTLENGLTESHVNDLNVYGLVGFKAKFDNWTLDGSFQRGTNDLDIPVTNNLIKSRIALATDAILSNGSIICATAATNPDCVPFNPFGAGAPSQAALNYIMGTSQYNNYTAQSVADTNLTGEVFNLPAGPVTVALGAQWRKIGSTTTTDALSIAGDYRLANNQPFSGEYSIMEEYAETHLPLLRVLDANLAARHTDYSTSGGANTWKAGLVWKLNKDLRVRVSRSRDIRAPNLDELFTAGVQTNGVIADSLTGKTYSGVPNIRVGNPDLQPETANSTVAGFTYQPSWIPGLSLALDTYIIDIDDAIFVTGGLTAVQQCNADPSSPLCAFVTRGSTIEDPNAVIQTRTAPVNLNTQSLKGTDLEASYRIPRSLWPASFDPGDLSVRLLLSYVDQMLLVSPLAPSANQAGNATATAASGLTALPRVRGTFAVNHKRGAFASYLQLRYIGGMTWDKTKTLGVDTDFNEVASAAYLDGQISYKLRVSGRDVEIYLNVQNVLDKGLVYDPKTTGATPTPTDSALYDQVGRMFRLGVRTRF